MIRSKLVDAFYATFRRSPAVIEDTCTKLIEIAALRRLLDHVKPDLVLDVGANVGQFGRRMRRLGYTGEMVSFEPDPRAWPSLEAACRADGRWRCHNFGLGAEPGVLELNATAMSTTSSFLPPIAQSPADTRVSVPVHRLDDVFAQVASHTSARRILLKLDTQGFDLQVVSGAMQTLPLVAGLLSELSIVPIYHGMPSYREALDRYSALGFDLLDLLIVNRTPDGRALEYDGLMVRRTRSVSAVEQAGR